ncbi:MAG: PEGA domain-containing protein [bacterium]|nr:PEGA domain-containing protein [bacterium]
MNMFIRFIFVFVFVGVLVGIILYARGYRPDFQTGSLSSTGIIAVSSSPKAAKVYVNGVLKGATDINLTLPPGTYQVEVKKEGYTNWSRQINLRGELVISTEALLYPINPSLSPLTNLGIVKAIPVDQTDKYLLFSESDNTETDGIYLFEATQRPLSFLPPLKPVLFKKNLPFPYSLKDTEIFFSPDYKQAIIEFSSIDDGLTKPSYLLTLDEENINLFDTTTSKTTLLEAWQKQREKNMQKILETFPKELVKIASNSLHIVSFSPDETKILYQAESPLELPVLITPRLIATNQTSEERLLQKNQFYIYDRKEDKNFPVKTTPNTDLPYELNLQWYTDSKRLVFRENKRISVMDYDSSNKQTLYSGPFVDTFFSVTNEGKIAVLTNLNPEINKWPDLYLVGIK